jgi:hypothetical protein
MPTCPISQIRKLYKKTKLLDDSAPVSLELVLMMCFPTVWNNIKSAMNDCYTQGYLAGKGEINEDKRTD